MRRRNVYLGLFPIGIFSSVCLVLPVSAVLVRSLLGEGGFTLSHYLSLGRPLYVKSMLNSVLLSLTTTLLGIFIGFPAALALHSLVPRKLRMTFVALMGTAANFAGVPLAVAFTIILGLNGVISRTILQGGLAIWPDFTLYSVSGLVLLYLYFQIPLFIVLILPALEGLRQEWREATLTLGGNRWFFWKKVALPILTPAILGNGLLLFANSFGAYATAFALVGAKFRLLPIQISLTVAGNVAYDPGIASAMATVMIGGLLVFFVFYIRLRRRFTLWITG